MTSTTPCNSPTCSAKLVLDFPITAFHMLEEEKLRRGWMKITTQNDKIAWLCPRCAFSEG